MGLAGAHTLSCLFVIALCTCASAQTAATAQQTVAAILNAATLPNGNIDLRAVDQAAQYSLPVSSSGSLDGSRDLKVPILPTVVPRLEQILAEVVANASAKSGGLKSLGQDTERAAAAGFAVRRGTQFFKDGKPFYFIGGNAYWFIDFYTLDWGREKIEEFMDTCQALGISVLRTWFFNLGMPKDFNRYDARQVAGMDYVIWAAKRRGLMLTLTMGNFWNAYRGPEDFLLWATGSLAGKDTLDFYGDPSTRALYKLHIWGMLSRVNPLTGLAPKDDPAIFSFNIINEPRCPGCFKPEQQAAHQDFLRDIGAFMRSIAPLHLISAGTEGFFVEDKQSMLHYHNPGPGAQCDGEDWFAISASPFLDYATVHVYERHLELLPVPNEGNPNWPNWNFCDFNCYVPWFRMYNQLHAYLAQNVLKKPVVIEEFGLTWFKKTPAQQRVLFKVAMDMVVASAESNGALAGAMFWNAAHNDTVDWDGYNVKIDRPAYTQAASALPGPKNLPATMVTPEQAKAMTPDNRTRPIPPDITFSEAVQATAPPAIRAQIQVTQPARRAPTPVPIAREPVPGTLPGAAVGATAATAATATATASGTAAAAAGAPPGVVASLAANQQAAVNQVPGTAAATAAATVPALATVVTEAGLAQPQNTATAAAANAPIATGRRLLGSVQPLLHISQQQQQQQQPVAGNAADVASSTAAGAQVYSDPDQVHYIAEQLSGAQLYLSTFRRGKQYSQHYIQQQYSPNKSGRQLLVLQDELDNFRRGPIREQCAQEAAADWRPYKLFNLTDDVSNNPRYSSLLQGGDVVAVISEATANLNQIRDQRAVQAPTQVQQPTAAAAATAAVPGAQPAAAAVPATGAAASATAAAVAAAPGAQAQPTAQQLG